MHMVPAGWVRHMDIRSLYTVCREGRIRPLLPREQLQILKFQVGERYNRDLLRGVHGTAPYFRYDSERRVLYRWHTRDNQPRHR
jgi:hypothetical protein